MNGRQKRHILAVKHDYSSSPTAVLTQHNLAESAKLGISWPKVHILITDFIGLWCAFST